MTRSLLDVMLDRAVAGEPVYLVPDAELFTEAPRTDLCRPHGIPFDRSQCPPDDEVTDRLAALAAEVDAHGLDVAPASVGAGVATSSGRRVGDPHPDASAWSMWDGARL